MTGLNAYKVADPKILINRLRNRRKKKKPKRKSYKKRKKKKPD